jgi:hypothetical protein
MPEEGGGRGISLSTGSIHGFGSVFLHPILSLIAEQISQLSHSAFFNQSLTVSPLLSEQDVLVLHEHFLHVELARNEAALVELETELAGQNVESAAESWPIGVPRTEKPPNRFQGSSHKYCRKALIAIICSTRLGIGQRRDTIWEQSGTEFCTIGERRVRRLGRSVGQSQTTKWNRM